ncbi:hypothetical protein PybrP1_008781 [[Pythium] brassicae (nom. inval.)]|nr:hypothetical protein PybrP1_008781 [[Pythium] brassicae (nom. inval.)]
MHTSAAATPQNGDGYSSNSIKMSTGLDITEGNTQEPYAFNDDLFKRMVNNSPTVIDAGNGGTLVGAMKWPTNGTTATKNTAEQFGRSFFKRFATRASTGHVGIFFWLYKVPLVTLHPIFEQLTLTANCQLKMRLLICQGQFAVVGAGTNSYVLKESIMSSGSVCPIMLASAESLSPLAGKLDGSVNSTTGVITGTKLSVAYGAMKNAFTDPSCRQLLRCSRSSPVSESDGFGSWRSTAW